MFKPQLITLQRGALRIEPMLDADIPALVALAEANRQELIHMSGTQRLDWYRQGLIDQREGKALPFVIRLGEQLVGTTRFGDFMPALPAAEIGWTWLDHSQHGTGLDAMVKYLMLRHAIEKLGAQREGVLRNHRRLADGRLDDSVLYSITDQQWPALKQQLEARFSG